MWQHLLLLANCNAEGDDGPFYNQNGIQAAAYEVDDKKRHFLKINKKEHKLCEGGSALCRLTSDIMLVLLYLETATEAACSTYYLHCGQQRHLFF